MSRYREPRKVECFSGVQGWPLGSGRRQVEAMAIWVDTAAPG